MFLIGVTYLGSSRVFNCKVIDNTCQETRSSYLATSIFESWFCPFGKGTSFFLLINFYLSGFICDEPLYSLFCACDISESLQDVIQARPSRFPISSQELFGILDDASEKTFLCGTVGLMQKYVFDGEAGKSGLETKNLVACTSFLVEQKLVFFSPSLFSYSFPVACNNHVVP